MAYSILMKTLILFTVFFLLLFGALWAVATLSPRTFVGRNFVGPLEPGSRRVPWMYVDKSGVSRIAGIKVR